MIRDYWYRVKYSEFMQHDGSIETKSYITIDGVFDDESGHLVCDNVINLITLKSPENDDVELSPIEFIKRPNSITINYMGNDNWYEYPPESYCGYNATMTNKQYPDTGTYSAVVIFADVSVANLNFPYYSGEVDLPFVDVNELRIKKKSEGFYIYWKNPSNVGIDIDIRPYLEIYDPEDKYLGEIYYRNVMDIEHIWVSNSWIEKIDSDPGKITITFQLRTVGGMNRTYTKEVDVEQISLLEQRAVHAIPLLLLD
jgi:hypothetical protein